MFYKCFRLKYINLSNTTVITSSFIYNYNHNIFSFTPINLVLNGDDNKFKNLKLISLTGITLYIYCNNSKNPDYILKYNENKIDFSDEDIRATINEICEINVGKINKTIYYNESHIAIYLFPLELIIESTVEHTINYLFYDNSTNEEINSIYVINKTKRIRDIINSLIKEKNRSDIDNGKDKEIQEDNILITFTTTINQKNKLKYNKTIIIFGECENLLKINYNISSNNSLYIIKLDINEEGMKIPKIEYEVYYPLINNDLTKLNLEICNNTKIIISIPVSIKEDINKYNPSSDYFNDICSKDTSKSGTDIILSDRKNIFINDNMSLCEEDCDLIDYDYENKKVKCSCITKVNIPLIEDIKFDKNKLLNRFTDINSIVNINVIKCYKKVFNKKNIKNNYGFFIVLIMNLLYYICLYVFIYKSFFLLKYDIKNIVFILKTKKNSKEINQFNLKQNLIKLDVINLKQLNTIYAEYSMNKFKLESNNITDKSNTMNLDVGQRLNNLETILEYKDFELNSLNYEEALKLDKRNYLEYYIGLLKTNHLFMFSFLAKNDYNSRIIKMFLFFLFFTINLTVNALFFNDKTMHKIYIDEGNYNFIYQIPQIIYSSIISIIINVLIKFLSLSQEKIVEIKHEKNKRGLNEI